MERLMVLTPVARQCLALPLALALAASAFAQDYTINLPLPPDPAAGGGDVGRFQLSPNGTFAAYIADGDIPEVHELFTVALDGARLAHKVNPPLNAFGAVQHFQFTPDSTRVLLVVDDHEFQEYQLYSAPANGAAPPVRLHGSLPQGCDVGGGDAGFRLLCGAAGRVVFAGDLDTDGVYQLYSAAVDGSLPATRLNGALAANRDVDPAAFWLSPDGSRVLYLSDEGPDEVFSLRSVPVDGSAPPMLLLAATTTTRIGGEGGPPVQITPDGSTVVVRGDLRVNDVYELFRLPLTGGPLEPLFDPLPAFADATEFVVTPDGARVLVRIDRVNDEVYELWSTPTHGAEPPVRLSGPMAADGDVQGSGLPDGPFQISADGTYVVYRADQTANDRFELFSAPVDGTEPTIRLTTLLPSRSVTAYRISPDSRYVVYLCNQRSPYFRELFSVPLAGGAAQRLNAPLVDVRQEIQHDYRVGVERVAFRLDRAVDGSFELFSAPLEGYPPRARAVEGDVLLREPIRLSHPLDPEADVDHGIALTNDGRDVLYIADHETPRLKELFLSPLDGRVPPAVQNGPLTDGPPFGDVHSFDFAGERMLYSGTQDDPQAGELFSVSLDSAPLRAKLHDHAIDGGNVLRPRVAPDALHVAYLSDVHVRGQYELLIAPVDGSAPPLELSGTIVPTGGDVADEFVFTADSSRLVFTGNLEYDSVQELYSVPADGSAPHVKLSAPLTSQGDVVAFQCSPDGAWVVYRADQDTDERFELYSVPSGGEGPARKLSGPLVDDGDVLDASGAVRVTADSEHVVFVADGSADGVYEVFAVPIDGSAPAWRLHPALGNSHDAYLTALAPDGQTVLFRADDTVVESFDLYAVAVDGGAPVRLSQPFPFGRGVVTCEVTPDSSHAVFVAETDGDGDPRVFSVALDGSGPPLEIGEAVASIYDRIDALFVDPGGEHVVYAVHGSEHALYTAWIDGSDEAVELAQFGAFTDDLEITDSGDVIYRAREVYSGPTELFRVPLLGASPPERLHTPLVQGREVTGFQVGGADDRVLFRGDLNQDERFELFLTLLD